MSVFRPRLAVTLGDCAGVGPETVLRALACEELVRVCQLFVYGSETLLRRVADQSGLGFPESLTVRPRNRLTEAELSGERHVLIDDPFAEARTLVPGAVQEVCGRKAYDWICAAVQDVQRGVTSALVTAPINKEALHLAGIRFPGHTEILAQLTQTRAPCMAFFSQGLIVSLATIHEALADVPRLLSLQSLTRTIRLTEEACREFGISRPRIGVLALNPHAGEHGLFGREEQDVLGPAIRKATEEGLNVLGPLVPDTAFTWLLAKQPAPFDAYVAMYHDQGLIPFKMVAFDTGVNVTLGLPIIRTSPDHGTAFNIAWQAKASPSSLFSAITLAARMATRRHSAQPCP